MKKIVLKSEIKVTPHTEAKVAQGIAVYLDTVLKGFIINPLEGLMISFLNGRTTEVYINLEDVMSDNPTFTYKQLE